MSKSKKTSIDAEVEAAFANSMPAIEELSVDVLKPYENNPRVNDEAVPKVAASLRDFGWQQPIVIDKENVIVAGHTRYLAALSLKMTHVPCVRASKLTPEQIRAYRLVDNKTNELATWDDIKLDLELDALPQFDFKQYGFNYSGEADDEISALYDDSKEDTEETYKDCDKITIKIPSEHLDQVRKWMSEGGREKVIKYVLTESGCIAEDDEVPAECLEDDGDANAEDADAPEDE